MFNHLLNYLLFFIFSTDKKQMYAANKKNQTRRDDLYQA